jgi:hypothetical protein
LREAVGLVVFVQAEEFCRKFDAQRIGQLEQRAGVFGGNESGVFEVFEQARRGVRKIADWSSRED